MNDQHDICRGTENHPIFFNGDNLNDEIKNFAYVCCNIPGPGLDTTEFEESIAGCTCKQHSCFDGCNCILRSNGPVYNDSGQLKMDYFSRNSGAVFECNSACLCSPMCNNRVIQNGITYKLEVFMDARKGMSLRSLVPILSNTFVCEYAGEILTLSEAKNRFRHQSAEDMNYIFVLNEHCKTETIQTIVDPKVRGNIGRFLNHSCSPNLRLVPVRVHTMVPRLCMFACRNIAAGEELTYDYSSGESEDRAPSDTTDRKPCYCGTELCTGYLPLDKGLL